MNDFLSRQKNNPSPSGWQSLGQRTQDIFTRIVDLYLDTGSPVGSKAVSQTIDAALSPASIRSIMAELERAGLLFQPHASAGRLPTEGGLRLFVDGLLEIGGEISVDQRTKIDMLCNANGSSFAEALEATTTALSGLSRCASLVICPKQDEEIRHVEFVSLGKMPDGGTRALVIIITGTGQVENRIIHLPPGLPQSSLVEAGNFLSTMLAGSTLTEAAGKLERDIAARRNELDQLTSKVVESGIAVLAGNQTSSTPLILRGHANLLEDIHADEDIEKIRTLFAMLEARENTLNVLDAVQQGSGVQIFIGSENALFSHTDCAMIIAPYTDSSEKVIGAVGVIGPRRMNYSGIIPMVNYTSEAISKMLSR
ncbi:MAG: heat-inducible transcriptional repressor HrcA [Candidatus Puniceispirillales bacterium]